MLSTANPLAFDRRVRFVERGHSYYVDDQKARVSVTGLVSNSFSKFDPEVVIAKQFTSWKANASSTYYQTIQGCDGDDERAKRLIKAGWTKKGREACAIGTRLHLVIEQTLNGEAVDEGKMADLAAEREAFLSWQQGWCAERKLVPYRTELKVFATNEAGSPVVAGCIDALFVNDVGDFILVDWKRSKSFPADAAHYGRFGVGHCSAVKDIQHHKYALQLAIYAAMLKRLGIDVNDRRYLVRLSAEDGAEVIHAHFDGCDDVARALLKDAGVAD